LRYRVEVSTTEQLEQALSISQLEYIYTSFELIKREKPAPTERDRIIIIPPIFGEADLSGFSRVLVNNIGHFYENKLLHGGFRLNITNFAAQEQYERLGLVDSTLSTELSLQCAKSLKCTIPRGLIVYGNLPMMLLRRPPNADILTDRKGKKLPVVRKASEYELLNPDTLVLYDRINDFNDFDFVILRLSPGECVKSIYEVYTKGRNILHNKNFTNFTRGLYYK
jgi:putative protease